MVGIVSHNLMNLKAKQLESYQKGNSNPTDKKGQMESPVDPTSKYCIDIDDGWVNFDAGPSDYTPIDNSKKTEPSEGGLVYLMRKKQLHH